jgi:cephalosporin hydroxylase|tara:strand:- start:425 stop:1036 length:612 start_codon:yes stop_codon:yes gene_type:complete
MKDLKPTLRFNYPKHWLGEKRTNHQFIGVAHMLTHIHEIFWNRGDMENLKMIEIGSYMGESTMMFASSNIFTEIHCIEPFSGYEEFNDMFAINWDIVYDEFKTNTRHFDNITLHKDFSYNIADKFKNGSYDFLYIDASHEYEDVLKDINLFLPKLKSNGIIAGHDYIPEWSGLMKAVDETVGKPDRTFWDTSWIKEVDKNYFD